MFTQKLSMDCTQEQYEKYLKEELEKMEYKENSCSQWHRRENEYITNCYIGLGNVGNINIADIYNIVNDKLTYLGKFNAPLFLALAAMTDSEYGIPGEYWVSIQNYGKNFTRNQLYKANKSLADSFALKDNLGKDNGFHPKNLKWFRKATATEIIECFTIKNKEIMEMFKVTRSNMKQLHDAACAEWKTKVIQFTSKYAVGELSDEVNLPRNIVDAMFAEASSEQKKVLMSVFPEYKKDKNAFIDKFDSTETKSLSTKLFDNPYALQISTEAARDANRMDLYGRGFYINSDYNVTLIPIGSSTVIEITKK